MFSINETILFLLIVTTGATKSEPILLFPKNTLFQITFGGSTPIEMSKRGGLVFSSGYQFNYALPWNVSQFEPLIVSARQSRNLDLQDIYSSLEHLLESTGWEKGRECLLRTICELAETPLARSSQDIVEDIIHLLLTPSEDLPRTGYSSQRSVNKLYQEAERLGRSGGDCILSYPDCIESPLKSFTQIIFP
ncbi:uncharacterized protein LOC127278713 [Leptopilina boulardi]|uniref:uncharacterized protein LOC127278713 n=1 Tax=Leptopilina boulardi TaxID=63433 RepID=UPI0021F5379F|nr:uncharacterized protein LOC127278713 [Leptopilina boulardi]